MGNTKKYSGLSTQKLARKQILEHKIKSIRDFQKSCLDPELIKDFENDILALEEELRTLFLNND